MKRSELRRKTPLRSKTEFRSHSQLRRVTPLSHVSRKRRAQAPERRRVVSALVEAQNGRCARCGRADLILHGHELLGMAHGADYTRPDVAVCDPCNTAIEDDPIVSAWNGWKISSEHPHDPMLPVGVARDLNGGFVIFADIAAERIAELTGGVA